MEAITVPPRSQDQAHQHLQSFCSHQVLHSLMGRTIEYLWIFRSPTKLRFQRVKNQAIGGSYKRIWPNHHWLHVLIGQQAKLK
jgi:hypothetical protein